jgi:hypothetical protein
VSTTGLCAAITMVTFIRYTDSGGPSERVPGTQRNDTTPVKIEIAKSGDLAYEYSDGRLSFELKSGEKVTLPQSRLRVWKKQNGQWKLAAGFSFPHWQEGEMRR